MKKNMFNSSGPRNLVIVVLIIVGSLWLLTKVVDPKRNVNFVFDKEVVIRFRNLTDSLVCR